MKTIKINLPLTYDDVWSTIDILIYKLEISHITKRIVINQLKKEYEENNGYSLISMGAGCTNYERFNSRAFDYKKYDSIENKRLNEISISKIDANVKKLFPELTIS